MSKSYDLKLYDGDIYYQLIKNINIDCRFNGC